jgi:phenylacetate-coenzyme A ligase PaaK-like adenylate-forming protein
VETASIPDIIAFLSSADAETLEQMGEGGLLAAFQSAAAEVPAYQDMLAKRGVDPLSVSDVAAFRTRAPVIDKSVFVQYSVDQLCRRGSLKEVKAVIPSSGFSGVFAFNVETYENLKGDTTMADLALEYCLKVSNTKTFLVNAYPMGLQVPTAIPSTNTGVNADVALGIIKTFAPHFEQLVIVSQPLFAKKLIEDGLEQGVDWSRLRTTVVTGGEGFVESWRTYMSRLIGIEDPDHPRGRFVGSSFGVGELAVNLFHEIPQTMAIIRRAYRDRRFRTALLGGDTEATPQLFVYYPMRTYIEELPVDGLLGGELVVSMTGLDNHMPFLRYRTGDHVRIVRRRQLESVLAEHAPDLTLPDLRLPMVAVFGRTSGLQLGGRRVTAEDVKEALFLDPEVAAASSGFFRATGRDGQLLVEVQLRRTVAPPRSDLADRLVAGLRAGIPGVAFATPRFYDFGDFPYEITYERKYSYLPR